MNSITQDRTEAPPQPAVIHKKEHSRVGVTWISLAVFTIILLMLAIFILQNSAPVQISYFGFHGSLSLGVGMLLAAVTGALLTLLIGSARILQLKAREREREDRSSQ